MDDIGYSWWTVRERCNGSITKQVIVGGHVFHYKSSYYAAMTVTKRTCSGTRLGQSMGNHDFYKWPYSHKYLYASASNWVP